MFDEYGYFTGEIPEQCVLECSAMGDVTNNVEFWTKAINFSVPEKMGRDYLRDFGAWDDLDNCDMFLINTRVLWIACCDIRECGEWIGLIH